MANTDALTDLYRCNPHLAPQPSRVVEWAKLIGWAFYFVIVPQ